MNKYWAKLSAGCNNYATACKLYMNFNQEFLGYFRIKNLRNVQGF